MITLGVSRKNEWGEYRVSYREDGRDDEGKAYYTEDIADAVGTLLLQHRLHMAGGIPSQVSSDKFTTQVVALYRETQGG